ncbi:SDR family NAD(P)-dependent oxidoreductase [Nonomuraea muscovyensis]
MAVIDLDEADCAGTVEAIRGEGGTARAIAADVADEGLVGDAVARVVAELGPPTVLVNNAGVGPRADLVEMTTEQWDMVLGVNLRGPFFLTRAVVPYMVEAGWGRIVTMSSVSAVGDNWPPRARAAGQPSREPPLHRSPAALAIIADPMPKTCHT